LKNLRSLFGGLGKSPAAPVPQQRPTPQYQRPWGPVVPGPFGVPGGGQPGMGWGQQPGFSQMPGAGVPWGMPQPPRPQMPGAQPSLPSGAGQGIQLPSVTEGGEAVEGNARGGFGQYMKYLTPENIQQWMQWMQLAQQLFGKGAAAGAAAAAVSAIAPASAKMRVKPKRKNGAKAKLQTNGNRRSSVKRNIKMQTGKRTNGKARRR